MSLLAFNFKNEFYFIARFLTLSFYEGLMRCDVAGREHIPPSGPFIIAANHLSFIDPPVIGASVLTRPIHYFARDSLFKPGFANWLLTQLNAIPYKRDSDGDVGAMKKILKILQQGEGLLLFIEGTRSVTGELQKPKPGLGMIACKTKVPVVPARIFGSHTVLNRSNTGFNFQARSSLVFGPALSTNEYDPGPGHENRYQEASERVFSAISALRPTCPRAL